MVSKKKKLNLDIGTKVAEFERLMHKFQIKNVMYKSMYRGKGIEFDGYREFSEGEDDVSSIDLKATLRSNKKMAKTYIEEKDSKIMFVVDVSEKMFFGSTGKLKGEYVAEMVASLVHLILTLNDKVGLVLYNEDVVKLIMPKSGKNVFGLFVSELSNASYYKGGSNMKVVLNHLLNYLNEDISALFIFSDFITLNEDSSSLLRALSFKHEVTAIIVKDPLDKKMPDFNQEVVLEDPVTGQQMIVNPSVIKTQYERNVLEQENKVEEIFNLAAIDFLKLSCEESFSPKLVSFLRQRVKNKRPSR